MNQDNLSSEHRNRMAELVARFGEARAAKELGVSQSVLIRCLAGRPIRRGSLALVTEGLRKMERCGVVGKDAQ